jgi:hypothetical protein
MNEIQAGCSSWNDAGTLWFKNATGFVVTVSAMWALALDWKTHGLRGLAETQDLCKEGDTDELVALAQNVNFPIDLYV